MAAANNNNNNPGQQGLPEMMATSTLAPKLSSRTVNFTNSKDQQHHLLKQSVFFSGLNNNTDKTNSSFSSSQSLLNSNSAAEFTFYIDNAAAVLQKIEQNVNFNTWPAFSNVLTTSKTDKTVSSTSTEEAVQEVAHFRLAFYPRAISNTNDFSQTEAYSEIQLFLDMEGGRSTPKKFWLQYKIALIDKNGIEHFPKEGTKFLDAPDIAWTNTTYLISRAKLLDPKYSLLAANGSLRVFCALRVGSAASPAARASQSRLCEDLEALLLGDFVNGKFSDMFITVKGRRFPVHKSVLVARSEVFAAMFDLGGNEAHENCMEIEDVDADTFLHLLNFIYFGQTQIDHLTAADLFEVADKYGIMDLKSLCENYLADHLEMNIVASLLTLADAHHSERLKVACIDYLVMNWEAVTTDIWSSLQIAAVGAASIESDITYRIYHAIV